MCILAFCEKRKMTHTEFMNCASGNDDGIGFGFNKNGKQAFIKGFMDEKEAWNFYKRFPEKAHIIHFRLGTAGEVGPKLTHPFICTETSNLLLSYEGTSPILFHNGMLGNWEKTARLHNIPVNKNMSDTRMLAMLIGKLGVKEAFRDVYSGSFIVLHDGTAFMRGTFIEENGIKFSNTGYLYDWSHYKRGLAYTGTTKKTETTVPNASVVKSTVMVDRNPKLIKAL